MYTLVKYLSSEPIENMITCLNYRFDKVIFFGRENKIKSFEKANNNFLKDFCNVKEVKYYSIKSIEVCELVKYIEDRIDLKDDNYIDLSGSQGLFNVAVSSVAYKYNIAMHIWDIFNNLVLNVEDSIDYSILEREKCVIPFNIETYIKMVGGVVRNTMHKNAKDSFNPNLLKLKKMYGDKWNAFSIYIQNIKDQDKNRPLYVECDNFKSLKIAEVYKMPMADFLKIVKDGVELKLFKNYQRVLNSFCFDFVNLDIKQSIVETGSMLEQEVYQEEKLTSSDCAVGVHLDWDGVIEKDSDGDVLNEIDVLRLDNYIPTFISCKNCKYISKNALYELESVAKRFGGNYMYMKLVTTAQLSRTDINRAKLMGIEIEIK